MDRRYQVDRLGRQLPAGRIKRIGKDARRVHWNSDQTGSGMGGRGLDSWISQRFGQNDISRPRQHHEQVEKGVLSARTDDEPVAMRTGQARTQPHCCRVTLGGDDESSVV